MHEDSAWAVSTGFVRVVPPNAVMRGTLSASQPQRILIEGTFSGRMLLPGSTVLIAAAADVDAELIEASHVIVHGRSTGLIRSGELEIGATANVEGSLQYATNLVVAAGAILRASIHGPSAVTVPIAATTPNSTDR